MMSVKFTRFSAGLILATVLLLLACQLPAKLIGALSLAQPTASVVPGTSPSYPGPGRETAYPGPGTAYPGPREASATVPVQADTPTTGAYPPPASPTLSPGDAYPGAGTEIPTASATPTAISPDAYPGPETETQTATSPGAYPGPETATPTPTVTFPGAYPGPETATPTPAETFPGALPGTGTASPTSTATLGGAFPDAGTTYPAPLGTLTPTYTPFVYPTATPTFTKTPFLTPTPTFTRTPTITPTPLPPPPWVSSGLRASDPETVELASGKMQLVEFFAFWCGSCQAMAPIVHSLEGQYGWHMNFVYLDIDDPAVDPFKRELRFRQEPHFFLLDPQGKVLKWWIGYVTREQFIQAINANLR